MLTLRIEKRPGGVHVVYLTGSVDSETHVEFQVRVAPVLEASPRAVILNMEGVTYVSSLGLSTLFKMKQAVESSGGVFVMTNLRPEVKRVFDAVKTFPEALFTNMQEADKYLDAYIDRLHREGEQK
jgi:anti-anti-sigma factor